MGALADRLLARLSAIDGLVNYAGLYSSSRRMSAQGYELQFAVNHLAAFLLTRRLLPALERSGDARVVTVSSGSHRKARLALDDLDFERRHYRPLAASAQSKLANVLFSRELDVRLDGASGITSVAMAPGLVNTAMGEKQSGLLTRTVWTLRRRRGVSPEAGADTIIFLLTDPSIAGRGGTYWARRTEILPSPAALDRSLARRLWELSEARLGNRI